NRVLRVAQQAFESAIKESLRLLEGEADGAAELLAGQRVLDMLALNVRQGGVEYITRLQRLADGKWVGRIHRVIAEHAKERSMDVIAAGFCHDVDGGTARAAEVSSIIATIDLKFLDRVLRHVEPYAAGIVIYLTAIHRYAIATTIAAIERQTALGRL